MDQETDLMTNLMGEKRYKRKKRRKNYSLDFYFNTWFKE